MVDRIIVKNKEKRDRFICLTKEILSVADEEKENGNSLWNNSQIMVVCDEFSIIKKHISEGYLNFEFGKTSRMLQSTYLLTDSLQNLNSTKLGKLISDFQMEYDRFTIF